MPGVARGQDEHSKRFSAWPELRSGAKLVGSTPRRAAPLLVAPTLFGLALYCRCFRVFDFHPMRRTARPVETIGSMTMTTAAAAQNALWVGCCGYDSEN